MRILRLEIGRAIMEVTADELDSIVNYFDDEQRKIGYDEGFNQGIEYANMDSDRTSDDS